MAYSNKVIDHYEHPRNVGSLDKSDPNVGTGMVGAPECGDVMKLQIQVEGESLIMGVPRVAVSSGSACTSASLEPSYVLRALGVGDELAHSSIRFSIGRFTTEDDVDRAADAIIATVTRLRAMSPLYEMVKEGVDLKTVKWGASH